MIEARPRGCEFRNRNGTPGGRKITVAASAVVLIMEIPGQVGCMIQLSSGDSFELLEKYALVRARVFWTEE